MLELARQHALSRVQFGRPIAGFQAVRHRLAETLVAIDGGPDRLADGAWDAASHGQRHRGQGVAGRNAPGRRPPRQQVLAGIGFTSEHPFHHYFRRAAARSTPGHRPGPDRASWPGTARLAAASGPPAPLRTRL